MGIWNDQRGANAMEYSILLFDIALAIIAPGAAIGKTALTDLNVAGNGWQKRLLTGPKQAALNRSQTS